MYDKYSLKTETFYIYVRKVNSRFNLNVNEPHSVVRHVYRRNT